MPAAAAGASRFTRMNTAIPPDTAPWRHLRVWQAIGVVLIAAVVWESLTPHPIKVDFEQSDKYGHAFVYFVLMLRHAQLYPTLRARAGWALGLVAMGVALEFLQRLTETRSFEIADMVADGIGVALGFLAAPPRTPNVLRRVDSILEARRRRA